MRESIEYYLSKGFDMAMAQYFAAGRKTIISVEPQSDYILLLTFDNGEKRLYDMKPVIQKGSVFEKISDMKDFNRVYIDDAHCVAWDIDPNIDSNIVWKNKIDLCPDCCYVDSLPISV